MQTTIIDFLNLPLEQLMYVDVINFSDPDGGDEDFTIISDDMFLSLCDLLPKCGKLSWLELCENNIGNLSEDKFKQLCNSFSKCSNLRVMDLSSNNLDCLSVDCLEYLTACLSQCNELHALLLQDNNLGDLENNGFITFCSKMLNISSLENINFSENNLVANNSLVNFLVELQKSKHIIELNLSRNNLGYLHEQAINMLYNESISFNDLKILNVADNNLGSSPKLSLFFASQHTYITDLDLSENNLDSLSDDHFAELFNKLFACLNLQRLCLAGNNFGCLNQEKLNILSKFLSQAYNTQYINLSANDLYRLTESDFVNLFNSLTQNVNIKKLGLSFNNLGHLSERKVSCLSLMIQSNHFLELDLSDNELGELYIGYFSTLCDAISCCNSLQGLNISANNFTALPARGIDLLFNALKNCIELQKLWIADNNFLDLEAEQITLLLATCASMPVLRKLDLSYGFENVLLQEHFLAFSDFIRQSTNLKTLKMEGNGLGDLEQVQIQQIIQEINIDRQLKLKI